MLATGGIALRPFPSLFHAADRNPDQSTTPYLNVIGLKPDLELVVVIRESEIFVVETVERQARLFLDTLEIFMDISFITGHGLATHERFFIAEHPARQGRKHRSKAILALE